jgi:hypothetical protein
MYRCTNIQYEVPRELRIESCSCQNTPTAKVDVADQDYDVLNLKTLSPCNTIAILR